MPRATTAFAAAAAAALLLAACSSDGRSHKASSSHNDGGSSNDRGIYANFPLIPIGGRGAKPAPSRITADGAYSCVDHDDEPILVDGDGLEIGLAGTCKALTVDGTGDTVEIDNAESTTVNGSRNHVKVVGGSGPVVLTGNNHHVELNPGGGAFPVYDTSTDSKIDGNYYEAHGPPPPTFR
jgi:hypothetical protein